MNSVVANRIIFILSLAGVGVTASLTLSHLQLVELPCTVLHGCERVAHDPFAWGLGIPFLKAIPTAAFGLGMYVMVTVLSLFRVGSAANERERLYSGIQWLLAVVAVGIMAWLTWREAFVIHDWCQWCVGSAFITLMIFAVLTAERLGSMRPQGGLGL